MPFIVIPNFSEGRDAGLIATMVSAVSGAGSRVLDLHSDAVHNRSVLTITGSPRELIESIGALAVTARSIDLTKHEGVHPRLGVLDVCPVAPHHEAMEGAVELARSIGARIAETADLPVYFYGATATREATPELPSIRRGGLDALMVRAQMDVPPDLGGPGIDPRYGVVCVGARGPLIAFNVWLDRDYTVAREIAASVRSAGGGPPGVRALAFPWEAVASSQISMNLIDPATTGIEAAFEAVAAAARRLSATIIKTEVVGLTPQRFLPDPSAKATRLLVEPGRSLESALSR